MLEYYGDVIAMRHFQQGAPHEAAKWSSVPVINCGDGWGEHPTQVLTDLYTIWQQKGHLDGLKVLCVGDIECGRCTRSSTRSPSSTSKPSWSAPDMSLLDEFKTELDLLSVQYQEKEDVESCIADADVIYMEPVVSRLHGVAR